MRRAQPASPKWARIPTRVSSLLAVAAVLAAMALTYTLRTQPFLSERALSQDETTFSAGDHTYTYVRGADSYSWIRKARNILEKGSPCEAITENGECRDTLRHAPIGSVMPYAYQLHINAIALSHRIAVLFRDDYPLPTSALWVQVIVGMIGCLPAVFLARRIGGVLAGLSAGLLFATNGYLLGRSLGADNDIWNVVLPVAAVATTAAALGSSDLRRKFAWTTATSLVVALQATMWSGWPFCFAIALTGLLADTAWKCVEQRRLPGQQELTAALGLSVLLGIAVPVIVLILLGWERGLEALAIPKLLPSEKVVDPLATIEPNPMRWITETQAVKRTVLLTAFGGWPAIAFAAIGILHCLLPRFRSPIADLGIPVAGGAAFALAMIYAPIDREVLSGSLACLAGIAMVVNLWVGRRGQRLVPVGVMLLAWLCAGLYGGTGMVRLMLLAAPAACLAAGAGIGALHRRLARHLPGLPGLALATAAALLVVTPNVQAARRIAGTSTPTLHDGWVDALTEIRDNSPKDAVIYTWWDSGYWVQYFGERTSAMDGASVFRRISYWFARALSAPSEKESVGLLRMLTCGSDLEPEPEQERSAYTLLRRAGLGGIEADLAITAMASLSRTDAEQHLESLGVPAENRPAILEATHCKPRPAYLVLTNKLLRNIDFRYRAQWDVRRAEVVHRLRHLPEAEALTQMTTRLHYSEPEARSLLKRARSVKGGMEESFISPQRGFAATWAPCKRSADGRRACALTPERAADGSELFEFSYAEDAPEKGVLRRRSRKKELVAEFPPDTTIVVSGEETSAHPGSGAENNYGAIVDKQQNKVVVGTTALTRSVFARLLLLEGRFLNRFEKTGEYRSGRETLRVYRIRWDG